MRRLLHILGPFLPLFLPRLLSQFLPWLVAICLSCAALSVAAADLGVVSGVIRDGEGKPLANAMVTLTGPQTPARQTTSGPDGAYRFADVAAGDYTVKAEFSGYTTAVNAEVRLSSASPSAFADLTLTQASPAPSYAPPSHPVLQFQAAGIHGLIDPGGYSASASSDAATGLLRGIADVKRTDRSFGILSAKDLNDWPCDLEPKLRKAIAEQPTQEEAYRRLGQFYVAHHQPSKAIPLLKQALQMDSNDALASRSLGIAWLQIGQFEEARKLFSTLAGGPSDQHRDQPELHQLLARADEGSGMFRQAAQEYRIADQEQPDEESLFGAGYELILAGSPADAVTAFQAGAQRYPRSIPLRIGTGTAQFLMGHSSDAVHSFLEATDLDPADPRPYLFLAAASGLSGEERDGVRNSFMRYAEREPDNATANYLYALVLSRGSANPDNTDDINTSPIEALLKRAIQLDPSLAKAHLKLADLYAQRNDYKNAVPEYEAAVRLSPDLGEAHYRLAIACKRAGRPEESAREMQFFQDSKGKQASGSGNEEINITQFISVMDSPERHDAAEMQCAAQFSRP